MKKEEILREELTRMRQLMGMNGSLYQKPIIEDEGERGHGEEPDARDYKGGERSEEYQAAQSHWEEEHQDARPEPPAPPPAPPAPPAPRPPAPRPPAPPAPPRYVGGKGKTSALDRSPKQGTSSKHTLGGDFVLPAGAIPKFGNSKFGKKGGLKKGGKKGKKKKDD